MLSKNLIEKIPANPKFRAHWIVCYLHIAGSSMSAIAEEEGVSLPAVSRAVSIGNSHLEPVIAGKLGLTAAQLFPERYDAAGNRLGPTKRQYRSTAAKAGERSKQAAQ